MDFVKKLLKRGVDFETEKWTCKCEASLQTISGLVTRGNLLNQRQCEHLSTRLTRVNENVHMLVGRTKESLVHSMQNFTRCLKMAEMLVTRCAEREWWRAAAFQWQNENAFQEILLDASLCYNVIYGYVKNHSIVFGAIDYDYRDDLRQSAVFEPASASDVREDAEDLFSLLELLVNDPENIESELRPCPEDLALAQSLASYLLLKMRFASEQSLPSAMEKCVGIMWENHSEHPVTWGDACYIGGTGATDVLAISTKWLGIPCFKKEFHGNGEGFEKKFLKEAAIMAHLKHPNIIQFLCCGNGQDRGCRFIGMELMQKSLLKLIEDQNGEPFSLHVTIDIIVRIARGMCYLHDQGIAHRDLKPQNVVVNELTSPDLEGHCEVKLIDYGTSKTEVEVAKSNTITYFGIGTTMYRAPELHPKAKLSSRGKATWFKADVFSFAMTCVHILTLQEPFKNMAIFSTEHIYNEVMNGMRPSLPKNCPQMLRALMRDCWNIIPSKRPTFVDICERLETFRHFKMRGLTVSGEEIQSSLDYIKKRIVAQSSVYKNLPKVVLGKFNDEDEIKSSEVVSIISCTCNHGLAHLQQPPYQGLVWCDICHDGIDGEVYHCSICRFDAHPHCAQIREKVTVFFHDHSLLLLTQNYYNNNVEAICSLCEDSIQYSEWVYRCEQCEYDVHATCTKFPNNKRWKNHKHPLIMRSCPPRKSLFCGRCSGEIQEHTWHYYCRPCAFSMHLICASYPLNPLCAFNNSHRLYLVPKMRIFDCTLCGSQGYSQFYHCNHCNVDIHPDCVDYMNEETYNWNEAYKKVMMEKESKDVHAMMIIISDVLDKMPSYHGSEARLSTQRPPSVMKLQPPIQQPMASKQGQNNLDASKDVNVQRNIISLESVERIKAKKMALYQPREELLEMLKNLEKVVLNLQSFENASEEDKEVLIATHERLKEKQHLVKEEKVIQEESKRCPGPRIGVFYKDIKKDGKVVRELLVDLQSDTENFCFDLLCEKPNHEHIVQGKKSMSIMNAPEELIEKLQPLLACGLQVVRNNITSKMKEDELFGLTCITIPNLEAYILWDLRAINRSKGMENMEVLKQAARSSSEWIQRWHDIRRHNIKEVYGLHRIRYTITEEGNPPSFYRGSLAWLCVDHFNDGLQEGILESCLSKYHNIEDDYEIQYPPYLEE